MVRETYTYTEYVNMYINAVVLYRKANMGK